MPFTYFIIDRMKTGREIEEIWLSEMPTPITFTKNIILWVDDRPSNNLAEIEQIYSEFRHSVEVLQLTSTRMVEEWMKLFSWMGMREGSQIKVISDMVRH